MISFKKFLSESENLVSGRGRLFPLYHLIHPSSAVIFFKDPQYNDQKDVGFYEVIMRMSYMFMTEREAISPTIQFEFKFVKHFGDPTIKSNPQVVSKDYKHHFEKMVRTFVKYLKEYEKKFNVVKFQVFENDKFKEYLEWLKDESGWSYSVKKLFDLFFQKAAQVGRYTHEKETGTSDDLKMPTKYKPRKAKDKYSVPEDEENEELMYPPDNPYIDQKYTVHRLSNI